MAYGDRRQPTTSSTRRTYTAVRHGVVAPKRLGVGRITERLIPPLNIKPGRRIGSTPTTLLASLATGDPITAIETAVPSISSLFSSADGGPNDKRVVLLAQAFQQAAAGLNVSSPYPGTGLPYLQNWIADQPPHPNYSNAIAQALITAIETGNTAAAQAVVPVSLAPAVQNVPGATGGATVNVPVGAAATGVAISPTMLIVGAAIVGVILYVSSNKGGARAQRGFPAPLQNPRGRRRRNPRHRAHRRR